MKYITFVVPCYNSESYMSKCIDSLLYGKDDVEILIIDDGSTDSTGKIADKYEKKYPTIVKAIHQKNGGHGEGINTGLKHATGKYFKVVDSDDWVDKEAYKEVLKRVKKIDSDLFIANYVYSYTDGRKDQIINFSNIFKNDEEITWADTKRFKLTQYLSLHSLMYKTEVLRKTKIKLPKHVFYEDNLFIYLPFVNTNTIYYLNVDFYRYYIGREGQSVSREKMIKNSKDQVLISKLMCNAYDLDEIKDKKLYKIMLRECIFIMTIGTIFSRLKCNEEGELQYKELWEDVKMNNPKLYKKLRYFTMAGAVSMPTKLGRFVAIHGFDFAHKLVNFN